MDPQSQYVQQILASLGFAAEIIPEDPSKRRADLKISDASYTTYIEVKSRLLDERAKKVIDSATPGGPIVTYSGEAGKQNHFSSLVQNANEQLSETAGERDYRVLWFLATAVPEFVAADEQMQATLLGIRHVFCKRAGENKYLPCYYAGYGDFYRYKDIDGAIIQNKEGAVLLVNEFSPRAVGFRESALCAFFTQKKAVRIPSQEDTKGGAFVVDGDVNRKDEKQVLEYLINKYPEVEFLGITDSKVAAAIGIAKNKPPSTRLGSGLDS